MPGGKSILTLRLPNQTGSKCDSLAQIQIHCMLQSPSKLDRSISSDRMDYGYIFLIANGKSLPPHSGLVIAKCIPCYWTPDKLERSCGASWLDGATQSLALWEGQAVNSDCHHRTLEPSFWLDNEYPPLTVLCLNEAGSRSCTDKLIHRVQSISRQPRELAA